MEGAIQRLIAIFIHAFQQLQVEVDLDTLEDLSVLIHKAMTVQARNYHSLDHVFGFVDADNPIPTLAALFHDLVYYQVDMEFLPGILEIISPFIVIPQHEPHGEQVFRIVEDAHQEDRLFALTLGVFDLQPGQTVKPTTGLNEFLSALVMNKKLEGILTEKVLIQTSFCIEATIPFRGVSVGGENPFDGLESRLRRLTEQFAIEMTEQEIENAIRMAVRIANIDVSSFSEPALGKFLESTWRLLPEMNVPLRSRKYYTIREYRQALESTQGFFRMVDPQTIFHHYKGEPPEAEFQRMIERARQNILMGNQYLRIKLLTLAILEALAVVSGGDAPLSLFMGELAQAGEKPQRLEDYLPEVETPDWIDPTSVVYKLFVYGREGEQPEFDLNTSPTSVFVQKVLPPAEIERSLGLAREMFAGRLAAREFLRRLDPAVVGPIARASAAMVFTRSTKLLQFAN